MRKLRSRLSDVQNIEAWQMKELSSDQGEPERLEQHQQMQELEQKNAELNDTITNLKTICELQQQEALEESRGKIAQLELRVQELQQKVTEKFEDQQRQLELQEEKKIAEQQARELADKNTELQGQNASLTQHMEGLTKRIRQQETALQNSQELKMENAALKANLSTLQSQVFAEKNSKKEESELLKKQLVSANEVSQRAIADSRTKDDTISGITTENVRLHNQNISLIENVTSLTIQKDEALKMKNALEREKAALEVALQSEVSEKNTIKYKNTELQEKLENTEENTQIVISESEDKDATINDLQMQLQQTQSKLQRTQNELEQATLKGQSNESLCKRQLGMHVF